jgi:hypothetical protein
LVLTRRYIDPDLSKATLHGFIKESIAPGSTIRTVGFPSYPGLEEYSHELHVQRHQEEGEHVLPRVHLVISQLKRWLLGTHQGSVRIPVKWATDSGDVGQSRSEATLVVFLH